jgi:hypothetical protein
LVRGLPVHETPDRSSALVSTIAFGAAVEVSGYQDAAYKECVETWARLASGGWVLSYYLVEGPVVSEAPPEEDPIVGFWGTLSGEEFEFLQDGSCQAWLLPSSGDFRDAEAVDLDRYERIWQRSGDSLDVWLSAPRDRDLEGWGGPAQILLREWTILSQSPRRIAMDEDVLYSTDDPLYLAVRNQDDALLYRLLGNKDYGKEDLEGFLNSDIAEKEPSASKVLMPLLGIALAQKPIYFRAARLLADSGADLDASVAGGDFDEPMAAYFERAGRLDALKFLRENGSSGAKKAASPAAGLGGTGGRESGVARGVFTYVMPPGDSDATLRVDASWPPRLQVVDPRSGLELFGAPLAGLSRAEIIGSDGDNSLTVDFGVSFWLEDDIRFSAGKGLDSFSLDGKKNPELKEVKSGQDCMILSGDDHVMMIYLSGLGDAP